MAAYANRSVRENREVNMEGKAADTGDRGYDFNDAFNRLCEVLGAGRQVSVGKILGVSQPSICYATKRRCIPTTWLLQLATWGINPEWVLRGAPNKPYLKATDEAPSTGPAAETAGVMAGMRNRDGNTVAPAEGMTQEDPESAGYQPLGGIVNVQITNESGMIIGEAQQRFESI